MGDSYVDPSLITQGMQNFMIGSLNEEKLFSPSTGYSNDTVNTGNMSNYWSNSRITDISEFYPDCDDSDSFQLSPNANMKSSMNIASNALTNSVSNTLNSTNLSNNLVNSSIVNATLPNQINSMSNSLYSNQKAIPKNNSPINNQLKFNQNPNSYYKVVSNGKNFNINAPSYVPRKYGGYDTTNANYANNYTNQNVFNYETKQDNSKLNNENEYLQQELQKLKIELILKEQMVKNLTDQIVQTSNSKSKTLKDLYKTDNNTSKDSANLALPTNHYQIFKEMSNEYSNKVKELNETKQRLEAILIAYSITNTNPYYNTTFTNDGGYDEQELAHKIICKLQLLQQENETLLKLISFGNKSSLLVELGLLKQENKELKQKIKKTESVTQ